MTGRKIHSPTFPLTKKRTVALLTVFSLALTFLLSRLFFLGFFAAEEYRQKVYDQITTTSSLSATRGTIYDRNLSPLATTKTVWRISVSPRAIAKESEERKTNLFPVIAAELAEILSISRETLEKRISDTSVLDVTVRTKVEESTAKSVLALIVANGYDGLIFTEASPYRDYPNGTLAAHVLGFTGSDGNGLYGLEYQYNTLLSGTNGQFVYAKDANGNALPDEYASLIPPTDGANLVTTLDSYMQRELESTVEEAAAAHEVTGRVCGVVMDVSTGAILAMATSGAFDPAEPYTLDPLSQEKLDSCGILPGLPEYQKKKKELLEQMWSNKAISETYEPGSTFKIITVSSALDCGAVSVNDTFSCSGAVEVGGYRIRCHKAGGHGSGFDLAYGLQMSCNPTMIAVSARMGAERFYSYIEDFGYLEKTGIDLPGEARSIFHEESAIGATELATLSFGQRFKVSIISQLTAISAVANGGMLVEPYVVEKAVDAEGKTVYQHETVEKRQVISKEVADEVTKILADGVSGDGGAKNARVDGYTVAAKTGTSQKFDILDENGNSYLRIGSTVAYAQAGESGGIAMILVVDEPQSQVKYGSTVAAPYVSSYLSKILPYLEYESAAESKETTVPRCEGLAVNAARKELENAGLNARIIGEGEIVIKQVPAQKTEVEKGGTVLLYTEEAEEETVTVPNAVGMPLWEANQLLTNLGFTISIRGVRGDGSVTVSAQSMPPGSVVEQGERIMLTVLYEDFED